MFFFVDVISTAENSDKLTILGITGIDTARKLMEFSNRTVSALDVLLKKAEESITRIRDKSQTIDIAEFNFTKNFFDKFYNITLDLQSARMELVTLASR